MQGHGVFMSLTTGISTWQRVWENDTDGVSIWSSSTIHRISFVVNNRIFLSLFGRIFRAFTFLHACWWQFR